MGSSSDKPNFQDSKKNNNYANVISHKTAPPNCNKQINEKKKKN